MKDLIFSICMVWGDLHLAYCFPVGRSISEEELQQFCQDTYGGALLEEEEPVAHLDTFPLILPTKGKWNGTNILTAFFQKNTPLYLFGC